VTPPRLRLLDTVSLARHYGVAVGTIHRWAHEDGWMKYGPRRARLWDMAQAQASYERRRPDC
jgi:uncharacterized protein YjcR